MSEPQMPTAAEADFRFLALVMSLATAAWSQLGKIPHPQTQKIERDLEQAKMSIDFLAMLLEKTEGNLQPKEHELLSQTVADLEMNFADEVAKDSKNGGGETPKIIIPPGVGTGPEIIKP
jgi:F0F1-type ATP synthase membrane subunit b/b'